MPSSSRETRLRRRPAGLPRAEDFEVVTTPLAAPAAGEVVVRNLFFRIAASVRMMISEGAECVEGVPFPALRPGDALAEEALGEVVVAAPDGALRVGDLVLHPFGWREYGVVPHERCMRIDEVSPVPAAHLAHGWTAYAALTRGVQLRAGDTLFVSSAAGAIGSMAGQIARSLGAKRVVGSTSSHDKARRLVAELGYDAAIVRGDGDLAAQLRRAAPAGLDAVVDNVGGEQLRAAVSAARSGARIAVVGALSGQLAPVGTGRTAPVTLDSFDLLLKRITLRGYSADDDASLRTEWNHLFADGLRAGTLTFPHVVVRGIEHGPRVLEEVTQGRHVGMVLIAP